MEMCIFYQHDEFTETFSWVPYEVLTTILAPPRVPHLQNYTFFQLLLIQNLIQVSHWL